MTDVAYQADGMTMTGHLARPEGEGPWPAVLIVHDGVGLESYQRSRADELAKQGYLAFAMDYHGGEIFLGKPDAMLARTMPLLADVERMRAVGKAALDKLLEQKGVDPDWLAALGYGAGALIVLELARSGVSFRSTSLVHPALPNPDGDGWDTLTGSFLLCTGFEDPIVPPESILKFGRTLERLGLDWRADVFGGARHAFWAKEVGADASGDTTTPPLATVPGVGYNPLQAARAWQAVLNHLKEGLPAAFGPQGDT